jgi:hypothetical protein
MKNNFHPSSTNPIPIKALRKVLSLIRGTFRNKSSTTRVGIMLRAPNKKETNNKVLGSLSYLSLKYTNRISAIQGAMAKAIRSIICIKQRYSFWGNVKILQKYNIDFRRAGKENQAGAIRRLAGTAGEHCGPSSASHR